jgi:GTP cyclohydrolase I
MKSIDEMNREEMEAEVIQLSQEIFYDTRRAILLGTPRRMLRKIIKWYTERNRK